MKGVKSPTVKDVGNSAGELRKAFTGYFEARGHTVVPSASLVPQDPSVLFTIAGMVPFKPYFVGDEVAPYKRATSVQKCFRTVDIEIVGSTERHCTFFEMLGNFSFGDYFKDEAIPFAWELVTDELGIAADRLWVTVHESDDEAEEIWRDAVGVPSDRIQRMGEDNFWRMGAIGPCGPCAEIYFDRGAEHGADGGPKHGGQERFVEIWNLVFMQFNQETDGSLTPLPRPSIDTGAGLERILPIVQRAPSIFHTDVFAPVIEAAETVTKRHYGADAKTDVSLRILADHARAMTFLVADGVLPSNEGRGHVLRRVIRRAVRQAFKLGVDSLVCPPLVATVIDTFGETYPALRLEHDLVVDLVTREEEQFRRTLAAGSVLLDEVLASGAGTVSGATAFKLHDTYGFPVELTAEIAAENGMGVDLDGYAAGMAAQQERARSAARSRAPEGGDEAFRTIAQERGPTEFTGYQELESSATVLAVVGPRDDGTCEVVLDRTPFYAESGGQVGDTGTLRAPSMLATVLDTTSVAGGVIRHVARIDGDLGEGDVVTATVDGARRDALRRNHTGTHLFHWALRQVLGPHVRQQGSLVAPDRLRFDFSHYGAMSDEEIAKVEDLVNARVLANEPVRAYETTRVHAEEAGAIAFFDEKYGDVVRVVEAGRDSVELCGGTHVGSLGMIGPVVVVSESSIGSNTRRIEALTGTGALLHMREADRLVKESADILHASPTELPGAIEKLLGERRAAESALKSARQAELARAVDDVARTADGKGHVVARRDGLSPDELRALATALRGRTGVHAVVLAGSPDGARVSLVAAMERGSGPGAAAVIAEIAALVGGGGGGSPELAMAGGRDGARIDEALERAREMLAAV